MRQHSAHRENIDKSLGQTQEFGIQLFGEQCGNYVLRRIRMANECHHRESNQHESLRNNEFHTKYVAVGPKTQNENHQCDQSLCIGGKVIDRRLQRIGFNSFSSPQNRHFPVWLRMPQPKSDSNTGMTLCVSRWRSTASKWSISFLDHWWCARTSPLDKINMPAKCCKHSPTSSCYSMKTTSLGTTSIWRIFLARNQFRWSTTENYFWNFAMLFWTVGRRRRTNVNRSGRNFILFLTFLWLNFRMHFLLSDTPFTIRSANTLRHYCVIGSLCNSSICRHIEKMPLLHQRPAKMTQHPNKPKVISMCFYFKSILWYVFYHFRTILSCSSIFIRSRCLIVTVECVECEQSNNNLLAIIK